MVAKKQVKSTVKNKPKTPARARTGRVSPGFDDMVEEVDEVSVPKTALSVYSDTPTLEGQDLFIPRLRLAQGLTLEVQDGTAKPGQWLILGEKPLSAVSIIPIAMTRRRELRDPDTRTVICRSGDGYNGIGNPGGDCSRCELAQWASSPSKKGKKNVAPPCTFLYSYMVYVVEANTLAILEFSRTSITPGKMLNTMVAQHGVGTFAVRLTSAQRNGPMGTYYTPIVNQMTIKADVLKKALAESTAMR
jgi:hypothetical protein